MSAVNIKFDSREIQQALKRLSFVSDHMPGELVNQKSYRIFQKCVWGMKAVKKETIERELGASAAMQLVKLKSGKYSRSKKNIQIFFGQGDSEQENFPLAAAIIQARARKSGKSSPWAGVSRAEGAEKMLEAVRKLYAGRQKSKAYFKATFATIRDIFKRKTRKRGLSIGNEAVAGPDGQARIANAVPAKETGSNAVSTFWLESPKHDIKDAIEQYAAPVLQEAMDKEADSTAEHAAELEYKQAIRAFGIKIS